VGDHPYFIVEERRRMLDAGCWMPGTAPASSIRRLFSGGIFIDDNENIVIHTSATPIAIRVGTALGLTNEKAIRLMAVLYNSSVTTIKIRQEELPSLNFNMTPHLRDASLITFR
jgi:hypothetical protein